MNWWLEKLLWPFYSQKDSQIPTDTPLRITRIGLPQMKGVRRCELTVTPYLWKTVRRWGFITQIESDSFWFIELTLVLEHDQRSRLSWRSRHCRTREVAIEQALQAAQALMAIKEEVKRLKQGAKENETVYPLVTFSQYENPNALTHPLERE